MSNADVIAIARDGVLLAMLGVALYTDVTRRKVYNWCTLPAIGLGLLISFVAGATKPAQGNWIADVLGAPLIDSLMGLALALAIFGVAYLLHALGGGDVKLMCAIGAVKGLRFFLDAAVFTACAGAVIAIVVLIWRGRLWQGLKRSVLVFCFWSRKKQDADSPAGAAETMTIPYVWAIAAGTLAAWVLTAA